MSGFKRYDEECKQSLVNLYQTGKTQSELCKDYGVTTSDSQNGSSSILKFDLKIIQY